MWKYINHAHSCFRWLVLLLLVFSVLNAFLGWRGSKNYTFKDNKLHLFTMLSVHTQVFIGCIAYYFNWGGKIDFRTLGAYSGIRFFFTFEHVILMSFAFVIITIGFVVSKRTTLSTQRFKRIFFTYSSGLLLIIFAIPWPDPIRNLGVSGWF